MKVLLTGAFGNIGPSTLLELLQQGHTVRCLDRKNRNTERKAKSYSGEIELAWGDLRRVDDVVLAVQDQDVIIHLAGIIPPKVDDDLKMAREVNVVGTRNLLEAAMQLPQRPKFLFSSTLSLFGYTQNQPPPRRVTDPVKATDPYTEHKLACEEMIKASGLTWSIYRFSYVPPLSLQCPHPIMFSIPLDTRIELLHPSDAGLAIANGIRCQEIWGETLLIGGGARCQVHYRYHLRRSLETMGIGMLPENAFENKPYYVDWLDTRESQRLLDYQRHTFEDIICDRAKLLNPGRFLPTPLQPLIQRWLLNMSPYRVREP
jgi:nucleoside-diphosphate-sugar epimerase